MNKLIGYLKKKKISVVIVTIMLGAIGSGVWEYIIKPSLLSFRDIILNITTLGISTYKNLIYSDIARGYTESSSLKLLNEFTTLYVMAMVIGCLWVYSTMKEIKEKRLEMLSRIDALQNKDYHPPNEEETENELIELKNDIQKSINKKGTVLVTAFVLMATFSVSEKFMSTYREKYINSAICHYEQSIKIAKPYLSSKEVLSIESEFAQINNKEEYISILKRIYSTLDSNGINFKRFDAW